MVTFEYFWCFFAWFWGDCLMFFDDSLTEVYFLGFSLRIKEGTGHTQSVKRPARSAGPESQNPFLSSFSKKNTTRRNGAGGKNGVVSVEKRLLWNVNTHDFFENASKMTKCGVWKRCAGASFEHFDSADLAEIAYGNRVWKSCMEIDKGKKQRTRKKNTTNTKY